MNKKNEDLENKESDKQGNWNVSNNHLTEGQKEERIKPDEMDKDESNKKAKEEIDEEGYVKSLGYQDIPSRGNDPAKNEKLKAPADESKKDKKHKSN